MSAIVEKLGKEIIHKIKYQLKDKVTIGYQMEPFKHVEGTFSEVDDKESIDALFKEVYAIDSITFTINEWDKRKNLKLKYVPFNQEKSKWLLTEVGKWYAMFDVSWLGEIIDLHI